MLPRILPGLTVAACAILFVIWMALDHSPVPVGPRLPGADNRPEESSGGPVKELDLTGTFVAMGGKPSSAGGEWRSFRGPKRDGICHEAKGIARSWGYGPPRELWSIEVGEGYAGAAVLGGRVYLLDYDRDAQEDVLRCLSLDDGKDIWRRSYPIKIKRNHGMSRTVPAVTEKHVVTIGPKCHVLCVDTITGDFVWGVDMAARYGTKVPPWYAGQCPLIDGDRTILAPAGREALMVALETATGETAWQIPNDLGWKMTHSSIVAMEFAGQKAYVYCGSGGVVGVRAEDGSVLWHTSKWKVKIANVPTPVLVGDGRIFVSGGYDSGSAMIRLTEDDGKIKADIEFALRPDVFGSDQQTPILYEDHIYGVIPGGELACLTLDGRQVWTSGRKGRFGLGPYMIAQGLMFLMNDNGMLTLAEVTPEGYKRLDRARVISGHDAWGPFALAGTRLIARDFTKMVCLEVGGQ